MMGEGVNNKKGAYNESCKGESLWNKRERETRRVHVLYSHCCVLCFRINGKRSITGILVNNLHDVLQLFLRFMLIEFVTCTKVYAVLNDKVS